MVHTFVGSGFLRCWGACCEDKLLLGAEKAYILAAAKEKKNTITKSRGVFLFFFIMIADNFLRYLVFFCLYIARRKSELQKSYIIATIPNRVLYFFFNAENRIYFYFLLLLVLQIVLERREPELISYYSSLPTLISFTQLFYMLFNI